MSFTPTLNENTPELQAARKEAPTMEEEAEAASVATRTVVV